MVPFRNSARQDAGLECGCPACRFTRENDAAIWWQQVDGTEQPHRLTRPAAGKQHVPQSFSRDGRHLLYDEATTELVTLWDLNLADGTSKQVAIAASDSPTVPT